MFKTGDLIPRELLNRFNNPKTCKKAIKELERMNGSILTKDQLFSLYRI